MKKTLLIGSQVAIVLIGIVIFYGLIRFPATEGRARNLDLISIYTDPLIMFVYTISLVFFFGLYKIFQFLGQLGNDTTHYPTAARYLKTIKFCGLVLIGSIVLVAVYISTFHHADDDPAGFLSLCIVATMIFGGFTFAAAKFEKLFSAKI
jgi:hypothetical protein